MADFDENIRKALEQDEGFQGLLKQLHEAATSEVTVQYRDGCQRDCGCKHIQNVKVPDYKLKLQIMEFLANRGVGRPNATESSSDEQILFERIVYLGDHADDPD